MHIFIFKATIPTDTVELYFHQRNYNVSQHLHYKLVVFIESLVSRRAQGFFFSTVLLYCGKNTRQSCDRKDNCHGKGMFEEEKMKK